MLIWLLLFTISFTFHQIPSQREINDPNEIYVDVMSHAPEMVTKYGRLTNVHETIHKMSGHHRVRLKPSLGRNSFYIPEYGMVNLYEPNMRKSQVIPYIPSNLRNTRFNLYIRGQTMWDDAPLYICDEWNAYLADDECFIIDTNLDLHTHTRYSDVSSSLQFAVYSVALYNAVKEKDPGYIKKHPEFHSFIYLQLYRTQKIMRQAKDVGMYRDWEMQRDYHTAMMNSKIGETLKSDFSEILTEIP